MYHLRLLGVMISCAPWVRLPLTVNVLNAEIEDKIKVAIARGKRYFLLILRI